MMSRRLDSLEKLVVEQRGAPPPHCNTDSIPYPLNTNITLEPYPVGFKIPQLETYDGTKDLDDHLHAFYSCMQAQNAFDALMCKIFPSTLRDHGHTTEQCNSLRSELKSLAQKGMLNEYIQRTEQPKFVKEQGPQPQGSHNADNRQGDLSSKQRKLYVREVKHQNRAKKRKFDDVDWKNQPITFTPADFDRVVIAHNDPLVTSVMINNCEVQRVFVDIGSALDIMYFHCFESLGLDLACCRVVKMASSFNVVIRRPTLTDIQAVISQSHLYMKFPTPMGIATLREIVNNRPEDETKATPVEDVEEVQLDDSDQNKKTQVGTRLNPKERAELIAFLRANKNVFAWTSANMPGLPTSVIKEEMEKLLQAGFVRRVGYCEWVANPVLVKNANASGNERLSLLDEYSGYHQVPMAPEDKEKTSFYAGDEIYCYVMMPFSLKNAGASYQKMVTIVFRAQIGRNLEVYVDGIMVKSLKAKNHLADLDETFNNLKKKKRMRLNPAKCIFGMESGKFLGFMVSQRGIALLETPII
ncbi:hypothetical protein SLEP1_g31338 [Rubroshorea leprosula]|uniref:Reverse transcriptase domain-containing protein n=1 Tax=Rubroshorea leprosula TaxID=152421 RepID=A0AAV5KAA3_9ROSI|nr:hypothetical protein SLEP1_g31338 [Rubroshorea leprosula]